MSDLLPCPFCGKTGIHGEDCFFRHVEGFNHKDGILKLERMTIDEFKKSWNTRYEPPCKEKLTAKIRRIISIVRKEWRGESRAN